MTRCRLFHRWGPWYGQRVLNYIYTVAYRNCERCGYIQSRFR